MALSRTVLMVTCTALVLLSREMVHGDDRISHVKKYIKKNVFSEFFAREREATMASSPQMEATANDLVLPHQRSRALNLATIASGSCYLIRSSATRGYVSVDENGYLFSTLDQKLARIFCVERVSGNKYYVTVENEGGSSSYIAPSIEEDHIGLKTSSDVSSPPVRFRQKRNADGLYMLKYDADRWIDKEIDNRFRQKRNAYGWIDKGIDNRLAVVTSDECYGCKSSKFELLNPPTDVPTSDPTAAPMDVPTSDPRNGFRPRH